MSNLRGEVVVVFFVAEQLRVAVMFNVRCRRSHLTLRWSRLNTRFGAEPNAPVPRVRTEGNSVIVRFYLNPFIGDDVNEGDEADLVFGDAYMYRLGPTNDEGFYGGQCRFSESGIPWGEFYELHESNWRCDFPSDRVVVYQAVADRDDLRHFLFYFRDQTFECIARKYIFRREPRRGRPRNRG